MYCANASPFGVKVTMPCSKLKSAISIKYPLLKPLLFKLYIEDLEVKAASIDSKLMYWFIWEMLLPYTMSFLKSGNKIVINSNAKAPKGAVSGFAMAKVLASENVFSIEWIGF